MEEERNYSGIFKSTLLFSVVEVVRLLVAIVKNKLIALLLGPAGMGVMGVFNTAINFIKTGTGMGLAQSAVRDVAEAYGSNNRQRFSLIINVTNKLVLFTSCLGLVVTVCSSPLLSSWGFGSQDYTWSFVFLGLAVAFTIYVDNQLAILKGMRQLRSLAKCTIIGSFVSLLTGIPLFYVWGQDGIVPSIIISAFSALVVSQYFVEKIDYDKMRINFKQVLSSGSPMLKMGCALMMINLLSYFSDLVLLGYIRFYGGLADIGFYNAGMTIITSYFGVVLTAMTTDYYPRISAVNNDTRLLQKEVNMQTTMGLVLIAPLAVLFCALAPLVVSILYSDDFYEVTNYTDISIVGVILGSSSNCIAMVLLAKQDTKAFLSISVILRLLCLILNIVLYNFFQLTGLGIGYVCNILLQLLVYSIVMWRRYNIKFTNANIVYTFIIPLVAYFSIIVRHAENIWIRYISLFCIALIILLWSLNQLEKMNVDILALLKLNRR